MPRLSQHNSMENFMESLLRDHQRYQPVVEFLDKIIHGASELSWENCEQIGLEMGKENRSRFCTGIRAGMIEALEPKAKTSQNEISPLIDFARKLNGANGAITAQDYSAIRDAGWNDQTIEDVIGLVSAFKVFSILANGFGFGALPAEAFTEMGQATVEMKGYSPVFLSFLS